MRHYITLPHPHPTSAPSHIWAHRDAPLPNPAGRIAMHTNQTPSRPAVPIPGGSRSAHTITPPFPFRADRDAPLPNPAGRITRHGY
ncbi:MAG: hypothetical protein ACO3F2_11140 [Roseiflexaceae bacterium]